MHQQKLLPQLSLVVLFVFLGGSAAGFDFSGTFAPWSKVISVEGAYAYFSPNRLGSGNAWNLGARLALLPFGARHFDLLSGSLDGALEVGLEPLFARFEGTHQNFGGVLLDVRYDLTRFSLGPFVPFIGASIGPGGSDLDIGRVSDHTRLTGSFMATIRGEIGGLYFIDARTAAYVGLQGEHFSNAGLNGSSRN
ncbi:MAG: acyloxyacyl hydrolase, partial [Deltaproteobacteria bacterium]|nr:acyloxyacyl hydrolase [Deltaproteobacteria bacterium]